MMGLGVWIGLWSPWRTSQRSDGRDYTTEQIREVYRENQDRWATIPKLILADHPESALKDAIDIAIEDASGVLSAPLRASLVDRLAAEIRLRSGTDPEPYLRYAANRPGERWIDVREAKDWERLNTLFLERNQTTFAPNQAKDALEFLVHELFRSRESMFCSIGIPSSESECGAKVNVMRVRSEDEAWMKIDRRFNNAKEREHWSFGPAMHARSFRVPKKSIDDIARDSGSVCVVHAQFVVETESHATGLWESIWYWDKTASAWQCLSMWKRGTQHFVLWY